MRRAASADVAAAMPRRGIEDVTLHGYSLPDASVSIEDFERADDMPLRSRFRRQLRPAASRAYSRHQRLTQRRLGTDGWQSVIDYALSVPATGD